VSTRKSKSLTRLGSLSVEHLESRLVPSASPLELENLILDDSGADPILQTGIQITGTPSELTLPPRTPTLRVSQEKLNQLAASLITSNEFLGNQVDVAFQRILGRSSGPGKSGWLGHLQKGNIDPEDLSARFIATEEFLATMGYNAKTMVQFMFQNYLDRNPSEKGLDFWVSRLENLAHDYLQEMKPGESRFDALTPRSDPNYATANDPNFIGLAPSNRTPEQTAALKYALGKVAGEIHSSVESRANAITSIYKGILHRDPSESEIAGWKNSGLGETELVQRFIESPEFQKQFQNVQELVAGAYSEVLFRPIGAQGLKAWAAHLGDSATDTSWISQIPGVTGYEGNLDNDMLNKVLQLIYANGVTSITTDELDYYDRFDPNLIVRVGGTQVRDNLPGDQKDSVPIADPKAFWEQVGKGIWNMENSAWEFSYVTSTDGGSPSETHEFMIRPLEFNDNTDPSGLLSYLEDYQLGSWTGLIQGIDTKLPADWTNSQFFWGFDFSEWASGGSWEFTMPVDPIPPLRPEDGFGSIFADLNQDGITDQITILRGDFFPGGETEVSVFFGQALVMPDPASHDPATSGEDASRVRPQPIVGKPPSATEDPASDTEPGYRVISGSLEGLTVGLGGEGYIFEPGYSFVPYKGYGGRITVTAGDFDRDGRMELATTPRDYYPYMENDGAFPEPDKKPLVSLFRGADGSFVENVPLPEDMVWKVWSTETDPVSNVTTDLLVNGRDGLVAGAGDLSGLGGDQLILATGGQNAQIWIGNRETGESGTQWSWTNGPLAKNQNAHSLIVADINFDGQLDIGLNATELSDGPYSVALYIPPKTLWFDGKSFEPIFPSNPGETIMAPDDFSASTFADVNGDGTTDWITSHSGDFYPESFVQVYFAREMAKPDPEELFPSFDSVFPFGSEPSYTFVPFKGYSGRLSIGYSDFENDGKIEFVITPRDYNTDTPNEGAFPQPEGKPLVSLFHGIDGSFAANVPLPADIVWKVWSSDIDPVSNNVIDQLDNGVDGLVVGVGALDESGRDQLILATGGHNAQIWIGNKDEGPLGSSWTWTSGPLAENHNAQGLIIEDINSDGQSDIGLSATKLDAGPITPGVYVSPTVLWFDGKTFDPISLPNSWETIIAPEAKIDRTWFLNLFEEPRTVALEGGDNRALLESVVKSVLPALPLDIFNNALSFLSGRLGWLGELTNWFSNESIVDSLVEIPEVNESLDELRTILISDDYKDRLMTFLDLNINEFERV